MSKIPYYFIPIPQYLDDTGWLNDPKTERLVRFLFRRCRAEGHRIFHCGREIYLEPFEFIFGRDSVADSIGLSGKEVGNRMEKFRDSNLVCTVDSKRHSKYTVYRWMTENFDENRGQQKGQQKGQHAGRERDSIRTAGGTQSRSESEAKRNQNVERGDVSESEVTRDPHPTSSPLFTKKENESPVSEEDDTLGGELFKRLRITEEVLADKRVQNFRLMNGDKVKKETLERWINREDMGYNFFHVIEWYLQRVKNTIETNKKKLPSEKKILEESYIERCLEKCWWKEYQQKKFARDEDEKQAKRHERR